MNLLPLSGPEPSLGAGNLPAAAGEVPPFTLSLPLPPAATPAPDGGVQPWRQVAPALAAALQSDLAAPLPTSPATGASVCQPPGAEPCPASVTDPAEPFIPGQAAVSVSVEPGTEPGQKRIAPQREPTSGASAIPNAPHVPAPAGSKPEIDEALSHKQTRPNRPPTDQSPPPQPKADPEPSDADALPVAAPAIMDLAQPLQVLPAARPEAVANETSMPPRDRSSDKHGKEQASGALPDAYQPPAQSQSLEATPAPVAIPAAIVPMSEAQVAASPREEKPVEHAPHQRPASSRRAITAPAVTDAPRVTVTEPQTAAQPLVPAPAPSDDRMPERAIPRADPGPSGPQVEALVPAAPLPPATQAIAFSPQAAPAPGDRAPPTAVSAPPPAAASATPAQPLPAAAPAVAQQRAPGLERGDKAPHASARAAERRSARAEEPIADPGTPPPAESAPPSPADRKPATSSPLPPPEASAPAPQQSPPAPAPQPAAHRDASSPADPQPASRLHFAPPRFADEVGIAIARRPGGLTPGDELVLQIEPANMGRIRVELRFAADGALESLISADQSRVLDQLRANGADLHRSLIEAGGRADIAPPRFEARPDNSTGFPAPGHQASGFGSGQSSQQQGHGQHSGRHVAPYPFDPAATAAAAPQRVRPTGATGRLDLIA